jgi:hypothetical protein
VDGVLKLSARMTGQIKINHYQQRGQAMKTITQVINNETGEIRNFTNADKAYEYQEYLVFTLGIDAEVL